MTDLNNITVTLKKSEFNLTAVKVDDKLQVTDPVTLKNQIQEIHSIDDLGLNTANRSDGSVIIYNANTNQYDVRPYTVSITNVNNAVTANSSTYLGGKLEVNLNVNSAIYSTNATFAYTANNSFCLGGFNISYFASNSSLSNYYLATNPANYINATSSITGSSNNSTYLGGKLETNLNVNAAVYSTNANFAYNSNTLNGQPSSYYTNVTNMSTGTLAESRLPYRMNQDVTNTANVQFKNLILSGTLLIANGVTSISANNFAITDNMIYLNNGVLATITNVSGNGSVVTFTADNNFTTGWDVYVSGINPSSYNGDYLNVLFANATHFQVANTNVALYVSGGLARGKSDVNPDLGFAAGYNDGIYHHTGFFRDHTNGTWKVFDNYDPEPDNSIYIDQSNSSFHLANFMANTIFVGNNTVYSTITLTNFSGSANNTTYVNNKTETNLNVNSSVYSTNASFANNTTYLNGFNSSYFASNSSLSNYYLATNPANYINATASITGSANNATYVNNKTEANLNVNSSVYSTNASFANNTTYLNGFNSSYFASNSSLSNYYLATNPAGYVNSTSGIAGSANNATYVNNKTEANLNVNSAVYSTNASFANNTTYFGGLSAPGSNIVGISDIQLITNKRINPRSNTQTTVTSLTPDISQYDMYAITAQNAALTLNAPIGTPVQGNKLLFRIKPATSTSNTMTYDSIYRAVGVTLPATTSNNKVTYIGCIYNSDETFWDVILVTTQA